MHRHLSEWRREPTRYLRSEAGCAGGNPGQLRHHAHLGARYPFFGAASPHGESAEEVRRDPVDALG